MKCYPVIGVILRLFDWCQDSPCDSEATLIHDSFKYFNPINRPPDKVNIYAAFLLTGISFLGGYNPKRLDFEIANAEVCKQLIRCTSPSNADQLIQYYSKPDDQARKNAEFEVVFQKYLNKNHSSLAVFGRSCASTLAGNQNLKEAHKIVDAEHAVLPFDKKAYFERLEKMIPEDERQDLFNKAKSDDDYYKRLLDEYKTEHVEAWDELFKFCSRSIGAAIGPDNYHHLLESRKTDTYKDYRKLFSEFRQINGKEVNSTLAIRYDCPDLLFWRPHESAE